MNKAPRRLAGLSLFLLVLLVLAAIAIPMWLIQPFSPQTPEGLSLSYSLRRWAPWGTLLALAAGLVLAVRLWRGGRWWSRTACALALVVLAAAAWASRQNVFEKMFAPLEGPSFAAASAVDWVGEDETVMAIEAGGEAVAFPVRQLAYHHIVQDVIAGEPIVATY